MRSAESSVDKSRMGVPGLEHLVRRLSGSIATVLTPWRNCAACLAPADSSRLCVACRNASGFGDRWRERQVGTPRKSLPVYALGLYRGLEDGAATPTASLLRRFKYGGDRAAGRALARALATSPLLPLAADAVLVPVPLHPQRLRQRGFNQAAWFARAIARRNRRPLLPDALECRLDTPSRAQMTREERRSASAELFRAGPRPHGRKVAVLVDDVCTTGATLRSARATLLAAGFEVPFAAVLLSTERSEDPLVQDDCRQRA